MNISLNSIKVFFTLNGIITLYTYFDYLFCKIQNNFLVDFSSIVLKNYVFINAINYRLKNVEYIQEDNRIQPVEKFYGEFHLFLLSTSLVESLTTLVCKTCLLTNEESIINDLIFFIPYSFCFEILFDLFHYITHYHGHNKYIYRYFHKIHHLHRYPISILAFYQHPFDLILTNSIPIILSLHILSVLHPSSFFMYKLLTAYKTFIEVSTR
jgi:sterol desaturase/sphingolipid hydroxylase (fatty acid hydroxylase superfamily)